LKGSAQDRFAKGGGLEFGEYRATSLPRKGGKHQKRVSGGWSRKRETIFSERGCKRSRAVGAVVDGGRAISGCLGKRRGKKTMKQVTRGEKKSSLKTKFWVYSEREAKKSQSKEEERNREKRRRHRAN